MTSEPTEVVALEAIDVARQARAFEVIDHATYRQAGTMLLGIKELLGRIAETFNPHIKRAYDAHRALVASKQATEAPLVNAERWLKANLSAYDVAQEEVRKAEELRRQEQARQDDEMRRVAEAAALEMEAQATGNESLLAEAQRVMDEPSTTPTVIVPSLTPKVAGVSHREQWTAEVENLSLLAGHAATHPAHLNLITPNQTALNALARALKGALQIPGVRAVKTATVAVRR